MWASAAANMRTYLLLKERAAAFRADPRCRPRRSRPPRVGRARACRPWPPARPTTTCSPTVSAFEDFDADAAGPRGYGYVRLNQLAIEHLLGAR